ncbi:MAG: relaxase/mobilization nuclease domain-containing protein [Candidatus Contendobacter sp.]|nr:relaxase/mobilization nuclease domain-containing protein [Candidatus Contendobacter sp.]
MVVKKVRNPRKSSPLKVRIHRLADYIDSPESGGSLAHAQSTKVGRVAGLADYVQQPLAGDAQEKCIYSGARGFLTDLLADRKVEMLALTQEAVRSKDPISHYVLSWREGEQPTPAQIEEAVEVFLDELGLNGHQALYGFHVDTGNAHLHLMINRVHPDTLKVIKPNKGFDLEAAHRAVARIEQVQGWQREEHGRYRVQSDGTVRRERHIESHTRREQEPTPADDAKSAGQRAIAGRTVQEAVQRAIKEGALRIRAATRWTDLHERLAAVGMRYTCKGSGALLWVGEVAIKASSAHRDCSLRAVERRLGAYQPAPDGPTVVLRTLQPDRADAPRGAEYDAARGRSYAEKRKDIETLRARQRAEGEALRAAHREQREALFQSVPPGGWRGRGAELNAQRSVLAARQAAERVTLQERHQRERAARRAHRQDGFPADDEELTAFGETGDTARRRRARLIARAVENDPHAALLSLQAHDIRAFVAVVYGRRVDYRRADAVSGWPIFVDLGREIVIHAEHDRDTVLAALQLAAQKWGRFQIEGDVEYQALCVRLAAEHGFQLGNPDLQAAIGQARSAPLRLSFGAPR